MLPTPFLTMDTLQLPVRKPNFRLTHSRLLTVSLVSVSLGVAYLLFKSLLFSSHANGIQSVENVNASSTGVGVPLSKRLCYC